MSELARLQARVDALERGNSRPPRSACRSWLLPLLVAMLLLAVLGVDLWLWREHDRHVAARTQADQFWLLCRGPATDTQRTTAFLRLAGSGHGEWRSANLSGLHLQNVNLERVDLSLANLSACDLTGARLDHVNLSKSLLQSTVLSQADLTSAQLVEADLLRAVLEKARFRNADLSGASLEQAVAREAQFVIATMSEAYLLMADLSGANLTGADLRGANLEAADLTGAMLALARFDGARLKDTNLTNTDWWRARGFTSDQIDDFKQQFSPTADADPKLIDDFRRWSSDEPPSEPDSQPGANP